jgi:hypothetical protein
MGIKGVGIMGSKVSRINPAILNGGALIVLGVLLLLGQLHIIVFDFWALVFTIGGVLKLLQSDDMSGRLWGVLLLAVGAGFELSHMGYFHLQLEKTWPVFVIVAGLILMLRAYRRPPDPTAAPSPHLSVFSMLGGGEYRIRGTFRGGDLVALLGGFDVDLRDAEMEGSEATITVNCLMGGGVVRVPETWAVSMRGTSFMGGHSLKTREGKQTEKTLILSGFAIMGGVEVRN